MSQALGCHNVALRVTKPPEAGRRKARLFGIIYTNGKMLSLRLGRGSVIREEEMPDDHEMMFKWVNTAPNKFPPSWMRFAQIQGLIYNRLYSPGALRQAPPVRENRARILAEQLQALQVSNETCEIKVCSLCRPEKPVLTPGMQAAFDADLYAAVGDRRWGLILRGDRVAQLALKCLVYRNISPPAGSGAAFLEECISTAREALMEHQLCMMQLANEESSFVETYFIW